MPTQIEIPDQGIVEFPDEMTPDDIKGIIKTKFYGQNAPSLPTQVITPEEPGQTFAEGSPREIARQQMEQSPIASAAGEAALETVKGFIPKTLGEILGFATPAAGAVEDVRREYTTLRDMLSGKSMTEAVATNFPETQVIPEAEKTPPFSKERFKAGFDVAAQMLTGAAIGKGLSRSLTPITDTITTPEEVIPSATQERQIPESNIPEYPGDETSRPPATPSGGGGNVPGEEVQGPQEIVPPEAEPQPPAAAAPEAAPQIPTPEEGAAAPETPTITEPVPETTAEQTASEVVPPAAPVEKAPEPIRPSGVGSLTPESLPEQIGPNVKGFETVYGPGEIKPGESINPDDIFRSGQADLAAGKDPYAIADRARTGDVSPKELGLLSAEHDRLLHEAAAAEGTPEYEAKYQQAKDFAQNMLKPAGTKWHQQGMGLQIKAPMDLSNLTGFRAAFEERFGKEMSAPQSEVFGKMASDVARAKAEDMATLGKTAERVQQRFKGVKDISFDDAAQSLHETIKTALKDCIL